ncbi:MAG TPA: hypothetical protein DEF47_12900 [Herpetosiphon sp.]|uniref:Lipoprotein n=1 Tax=Herpetosiphon aurantiacus (strain ATCC 23779 / DSM 785 / 114-95) TaxID=316274 RepID=A9AV31_HERA2|nr:hypothetical protein [Herpetosiphon sp.]ABX03109.1 hypothetical protein Haur_0458 [Herpetosiphon aurantiacus DSM 785]HBW50789.1 hypothetical protein [Herpetosiphon sp.]
MQRLIVAMLLLVILIGCRQQQTTQPLTPSPINSIDSRKIEAIILKPFQNEQIQNLQMYPVAGLNEGMLFVYQLDSARGKAIGLLTGVETLGEFSIRSQSLDILGPQKPYGFYLSNDGGQPNYIGYGYIQHPETIKQLRIILSDGNSLVVTGNTITGLVMPKHNPPIRLEVVGIDGTIIEQNPITLPTP